MTRRKRNPWASWDVQSYVLEAYAGVEEVKGRPTRRFLWADADGEVWIGNSAALAVHVAERFGFTPGRWDFVVVNRIVLDAGERVQEEHTRTARGVRGPQAQEPDQRRVR